MGHREPGRARRASDPAGPDHRAHVGTGQRGRHRAALPVGRAQREGFAAVARGGVPQAAQPGRRHPGLGGAGRPVAPPVLRAQPGKERARTSSEVSP